MKDRWAGDFQQHRVPVRGDGRNAHADTRALLCRARETADAGGAALIAEDEVCRRRDAGVGTSVHACCVISVMQRTLSSSEIGRVLDYTHICSGSVRIPIHE
eukprot:1984217-Rhodomonas_salina.1